MIEFDDCPPKLQKLSNREIAWIYTSLFPQGRFDSIGQAMVAVGRCMKASQEQYENVEQLLLKSGSYLLPDSQLEWIDRDNPRQLRWLRFYLAQNSSKHQIYIDPLTEESMFYDAFIRRLDIWYSLIEAKAFFINQTKTAWSNLLLQDKKLEWLKMKEGPPAEWAWAYIQEALIQADKLYLIGRYGPTNKEETLSYIHTVFDCWPGHLSELREIHSKMKRAWAQQKYRASLDEKKQVQSTFVIDNDSKRHLFVMARDYAVNQNQMLDSIIKKAFKEYQESKIGPSKRR